jgi:hypothetical protein
MKKVERGVLYEAVTNSHALLIFEPTRPLIGYTDS